MGRTSGGFFTGFGTTSIPNQVGSPAPGNINCPQNTRAVGFSFLPNDFGIEKLQVGWTSADCTRYEQQLPHVQLASPASSGDNSPWIMVCAVTGD